MDDNRDGADSLAMMLRIMGNDTPPPTTARRRWTLAGEFRPDVMLLDIGLPKLNGYEACRRIREQPWGKDVVMIAVTGWGQEEDRRRSHEAGFDHHMVKPVDPQRPDEVAGRGKRSEGVRGANTPPDAPPLPRLTRSTDRKVKPTADFVGHGFASSAPIFPGDAIILKHEIHR